MDKTTLYYCIPSLQKLVHQALATVLRGASIFILGLF